MSVNHKRNLNPLCIFPEEINDLFVQHVTGAELLKLSEVSTEFYDIIADSARCMKKIKIHLKKKEFSEDEKMLMAKSCRKYQTLEIAQFNGLLKATKEIIEGRNLKVVVIKCIDFETIVDAAEFFNILEPSIEELRMDQVYIKSVVRRHEIKQKSLEFPKLKVLETKCCQALLYYEVFVSCKTLKTFVIKSGSHISTLAREAIKTILRVNTGIEVLGIHFNVFNLIFSENIGESVQFKLREFHANDLYRVPQFYNQVKVNLQKFLMKQMKTLEAISMSDWMGVDVTKMIFHIPKMKQLSLKGFHHTELDVEWEKMELHRNLVVESLEFSDMSNNFLILEEIIKTLPNLKVLKLYSMDQKSMEFLSLNCKLLVSLFVEHFRATDVSNEKLFKNLQQFSYRRIDENMKSETKYPLTKFEKLIFK